MLRLTDLRLPINHPEEALGTAIIKRLRVKAEELKAYTIFRRGYDARKPDRIILTYTIDAEVKNEAAVLKRLRNERTVSVAPSTEYRFVAKAPTRPCARPVVIGMGPCGMFAGL